MACTLKLELKSDFSLDLWFDMDQAVAWDRMRDGVASSKCLIMILTPGVLTREFCRWELLNALLMEKPVIFVHEEDERFGRWIFSKDDYLKDVPSKWHKWIERLIPYSQSIAYRRVGYERKAMLKEINDTISNPEKRCLTREKRKELSEDLKKDGNNVQDIFKALEKD